MTDDSGEPRLLQKMSENWQKLVVDNLSIYAVFAMDLERTALSWNPGVKEVLGYEQGEFIGRSADVIFTEEDRATGVPEREARAAIRDGDANDVRWHMRKDGSRFWGTGAMVALKADTGDVFGLAKVVRDSTAQKQAEDALKESQAALQQLNARLEDKVRERTREVRELAAQLTLAEAQERTRLARRLHDELQQQLFAVQFALQPLRDIMTEAGGDALADVEELLKEAVRMTRQVTTDMNPSIASGAKLTETLHVLSEQMLERYGLSVTVRGEATVPSDALRLLLFNLARELLFNVVKHAGVDEANLYLRELGGQVELTVEDHGKGFDTASLAASSQGTGLGLAGIKERLHLFGGSLRISSAEGGTRVTVVLPIAGSGPGKSS